MYTISSKFYSEVADRLRGLIDCRGYYSGSFEFDFEDVHCLMRISCVIHRSSTKSERRCTMPIEDIIPVWWEFHTFDHYGNELLNEFSFNELRIYLKEV